MENRYKIIISNRNIYKEIELSPSSKEIKVGTGTECDIRLRKDLFFGQIELLFIKNNNQWTVFCSDNLYLTAGDVRKLITKDLSHGDELTLKYQDSDNEVFSLSFMVDFDNGKKRYERKIQIDNCSNFSIGANNSCNIVLKSQYAIGDYVQFSVSKTELQMTVNTTTYGAFHNGKIIKRFTKINNGDFFTISDYVFYYKDHCIWTEIRKDIIINGLNATDIPYKNNYPRFNRNTRIKNVINVDKIDILDPPAIPQKPKNSLLTKLLPSIGMIAAAGVMASMGGITMLIFSGISAVMSVVTAIITMRQSKKEYEQKVAERIEKYNYYIENKEKDINEIRIEEKQTLEDIYISSRNERILLREFSANLFDRVEKDDDFLCVRLGLGSIEAQREINFKKQEKLEVEDELQKKPEEIFNKYKYIDNAPIICDFKDSNAIGIIGNVANRYEILKKIVVDIAARHYFSDVKMFFISEEKNSEYLYGLRMLPHVFNEQTETRNIVADDESKNYIFEYLYKELSFRESNKTKGEHFVIFFFDEYGFKSHPISKFADNAKELGITFVFFGATKADIPIGCDYIIESNGNYTGNLIKTVDRKSITAFNYDSIPNETMNSIAKLLAPVYTEEISLEGTLTKNYSMFEMLNILSVDDLDLTERWKQSEVYKSMSAPVGISTSGIVNLDLHDKAHGPHGLVAGTTGSGKSEILQTYILSMATLFNPYEVAFVIIDFKGGGMVNQFKNLPHLLGAITNIDGKEIERSLKSIKAELKKRQKLFADADVNHIDKYIKKYKAHEVSEPLPHLIIIVDEFAELKAEQPEFMKELISAARIGRSLGVHLILATQKPSGQVNEQIWSNSRFKLCLKVQSHEDSNEVLKSPLAAEIKEPGRAYLQVGNNEIFELFQSAYSGASEKIDDSNVKEFTINALTPSGKRTPVYIQKKQKDGGASITQLDAIVKYVSDYCIHKQINKLTDICLPSLSEIISFPEQFDKSDPNAILANIGIYDDPDNQYQGIYSIDLTNENMMIIGSSQSGKTILLQTIIKSLASKYSPEEVNIYIIDFASMVLKTFESLNHVGGVVTPSEDEKLKNLMKLLFTEIENRKEKLLTAGVSSFSAYKEAGKTDLPNIVLIIDNLAALKELYFQDDDELLNICREGISVGISIIIANSQTSGIGYRYLTNFSCKIAMFCNDSSEYHSLFEHCNEKIDAIPGRSIIEIDKTHYECQVYMPFEGEKEYERAIKIKEFVAKTNEQYSDSNAVIIPQIPEILNSEYMYSNFKREMHYDNTLVVGLDYSTVSPYSIDFSQLGIVGVSGKEDSGKHNFFKYIIDAFEKNHSGESEIHIIDSISRKLFSHKNKANVATYELLTEKAFETISDVERKLAYRYSEIAHGNSNALAEEKIIVLLLNSFDVIEALCANQKVYELFKNIVGKYKNMKVAVIIGGLENTTINYNSPEIHRMIRDSKHLFFFGDIMTLKLFDLPMSMIRENKKSLSKGDCFYINDVEIHKLKTPLNIEEQ